MILYFNYKYISNTMYFDSLIDIFYICEYYDRAAQTNYGTL